MCSEQNNVVLIHEDLHQYADVVRCLSHKSQRQAHERSTVSFQSNLQLAYDVRVCQKKIRSFLQANFCIMPPCTSEKMS